MITAIRMHALKQSVFLLAIITLLLASAALLEASDNSTVNFGANSNITAFSTCKKVTNSSATVLSVYVPTQTSEEWISFYANPPTGVTAATCPIFTISAGTNLNLCTLAGNPTTPDNYVFTISAGVVINSNSTSQAALTTGTCWAAGSTVTVINNGAIYGRGGDGGRGATDPSCGSTNGSAGGAAMSMSYSITIDNSSGSIFGGGGGGGGGGSTRDRLGRSYGGGGGGGGQGSANSSGGSGGSGFGGGPSGSAGGSGTVSGPGAGGSNTSSSLSGGGGGAWGSTGGTGASGNICNGTSGGAGGAAIQRNGYTITWTGGNDATHVKGVVQ